MGLADAQDQDVRPLLWLLLVLTTSIDLAFLALDGKAAFRFAGLLLTGI